MLYKNNTRPNITKCMSLQKQLHEGNQSKVGEYYKKNMYTIATAAKQRRQQEQKQGKFTMHH